MNKNFIKWLKEIVSLSHYVSFYIAHMNIIEHLKYTFYTPTLLISIIYFYWNFLKISHLNSLTHSFMKYFFLTKIICMGKAFSFRSANSFEDSVDMFCHNWIQLGKPQKIFVDIKSFCIMCGFTFLCDRSSIAI